MEYTLSSGRTVINLCLYSDDRQRGIRDWNAKGFWLITGKDIGFAWQGCDCCGSTLGGDKHELFAMRYTS